jgi:hypothetical protein
LRDGVPTQAPGRDGDSFVTDGQNILGGRILVVAFEAGTTPARPRAVR